MQLYAPTPSDGFEPWELDTASAVVRSYFRERRHPSDEGREQELVQECLIQWWLRRDRYDPTRGASRRTFMNRVCENHLRDLARRASAQRRGGGRLLLSLDVPVTEDGDSLADRIRDASPVPQSEVEARDLASRLESVRRRLPGRQRDVLDGLAEARPVVALAREIGVSRDTVYEDIKRIREICRDEGLEEFLR